MSVLVMTCPHCAAENMTFNVRADTSHKSEGGVTRSALALCAKCDKPVCITASWDARHGRPRNDWHLHSEEGNLLDLAHLTVRAIWPEPPLIDAPAHLPERVLRAYLDAARARRVQLWNPACSAYRRCMELALKEFAPDVEAWKIEKRIDKLAAEHRITRDIKEWAHELRLDGNEAVHGDEDATQEITDQMHHLTYFLLTYLYTLPQQVVNARERRDAATVT